MHQALQGGTFHVEHITPSVRGGASTLYQTMKLPIKFIGVGEALDELQPFGRRHVRRSRCSREELALFAGERK